MKNKEGLIVTIIAIIIIVSVYTYQFSTGKSLVWSYQNGRWIWVDKDGKP